MSSEQFPKYSAPGSLLLLLTFFAIYLLVTSWRRHQLEREILGALSTSSEALTPSQICGMMQKSREYDLQQYRWRIRPHLLPVKPRECEPSLLEVMDALHRLKRRNEVVAKAQKNRPTLYSAIVPADTSTVAA